jgi:Uncharacterized protein conserved in archaea
VAVCAKGTDNESTRLPSEVVRARGHDNVTARHESTLEVTTDDWLTPAGDCILAVEADRAPADFDDVFIAACRDRAATITATLRVTRVDDTDPVHETSVTGRGHPELTFDSERSAVCRTSEYVDDRTVMVDAEGAAGDLGRDIATTLSDPDIDLTFELTVDPA